MNVFNSALAFVFMDHAPTHVLRGRPRNTWVGQVRKDGGVPISTAWTRAMDRRLWGRGRDGLKAAVPNLWVATPRGVAIDFHWGRH